MSCVLCGEFCIMSCELPVIGCELSELWVVVSRYKFVYELKLMGHRRLVLLHGNLMMLL